MANRQSLKKCIQVICEELFTECIALMQCGAIDAHNGQALLFSIAHMQNDFTSRISHQEPGMPAKTYFKALREDFAAQASDLNDQIRNYEM